MALGFLRVYFVSKHIDVVFKTLAVNRDVTAEDICHLICRRFRLPQSGRESYALYEVGHQRRNEVAERGHSISCSLPMVCLCVNE